MKTHAESHPVHILFHVLVVLLLVWIVALRQYQLINKLSSLEQKTERPRTITVVNIIKPVRSSYFSQSGLSTAYLKKRLILLGHRRKKALMRRLLRPFWRT